MTYRYMISIIEAVHWDLAFVYSSNDLDPHLKVTEVKHLNTSWICLVAHFVIMRSRRFPDDTSDARDSLRQKSVSLIMLKVAADFDLLC